MQENKRFNKEILVKNIFIKRIKISHEIFKILEKRQDAYPLALKWVKEWLDDRKFIIKDSDKQTIRDLIDNPYIKIKNKDLKEKMKSQLELLLEKISGKQNNVGFAISFYLFTWNIRRFEDYFITNNNFLLLNYFEKVGNELEKLKDQFQYFKDKHLIYENKINENKVRKIYQDVQNILKSAGKGDNEPVGTIKLLHIFSPYYFPLLDNPIAEHMGLIEKGNDILSKNDNKNNLNDEKYILWMKVLKSWLEDYKDVIKELEKEFEKKEGYKYSILKLIDEEFYMMCSMGLINRINNLTKYKKP